MMVSTACYGSAVVLLASRASLAVVPTTQPDAQQQLLDEVRSLRAEVKELKAQQQANAKPISSVPADASGAGLSYSGADAAVQADASRRSRIFEGMSGVTAGYANDRFFIQSDDGKFVLATVAAFPGTVRVERSAELQGRPQRRSRRRL